VPGPPCHRLGYWFLRQRWRGALPRAAVRFSSARDGSLFECARRFAFSAPGVQRTIRMTCGPRPPCHRLGRLGVRCVPVVISYSVLGRERESLP
jgi:hypothetical protein